jgi:hypothetical protein
MRTPERQRPFRRPRGTTNQRVGSNSHSLKGPLTGIFGIHRNTDSPHGIRPVPSGTQAIAFRTQPTARTTDTANAVDIAPTTNPACTTNARRQTLCTARQSTALSTTIGGASARPRNDPPRTDGRTYALLVPEPGDARAAGVEAGPGDDDEDWYVPFSCGLRAGLI